MAVDSIAAVGYFALLGYPPFRGSTPEAVLAKQTTDRVPAMREERPEIGSELFLSVHTVKTHMRKLYAKLDVHTRAEAVQRGRALGLLAPARRGD